MAQRRERATGVFATTFAFTVFLIFLLFAVQLLFGLHARTLVTAVATDIAQRAASSHDALTSSRIAHLEAVGQDRLGRYGDDVSFHLDVIDADGDGHGDVVTVRVDADLPSLLPLRWSGGGVQSFTTTARARVEQLR